MGYAARRFLLEASPVIVEALPRLMQVRDCVTSSLSRRNAWPTSSSLAEAEEVAADFPRLTLWTAFFLRCASSTTGRSV
jgi:hypothetical protein